jgi:hypothetical protein
MARPTSSNIPTLPKQCMTPYLSAVATSEENDHGSRGDGRAQLPLVLAEGLNPVALQFAGHILCWVVAGLGCRQIRLTTIREHGKPSSL